MRVLASLACALAAGAAVAGDIDASAPWRGWAGSGGTSELELRVPASTRAGPVEFELLAGERRIVATVAAKAGVVSTLRVPVPTADEVVVSAQNPDGAAHTTRVIFQRSERPILAWAITRPGELADPDVNLLPVSAADLPKLAASYGSVAAIAIDDATLTALDDQQMSALLNHVRVCGLTLLSGVTAEVQAAFARVAGCGGRSVLATAQQLDAAEALRLFTSREAYSSVPARALGSLGPSDTRLPWVIAALCVYAALAGAALVVLRRPALLLAIPLAAAPVVGLAFFFTPPQQQFVVWAEARSGDAQARFTGRLSVRAAAPRTARVQLPPLIRQADACNASDRSVARWDPQQQHVAYTDSPQRLFGTQQFCFTGSFPLALSARAVRIEPTQLEVTNSGAAAWENATLIWEGQMHTASGTRAGQALRFDTNRGTPPATAAQQLAAERLGWGQAGLLVPLQLTALGMSAGNAAGWVLLSIPVSSGPQS